MSAADHPPPPPPRSRARGNSKRSSKNVEPQESDPPHEAETSMDASAPDDEGQDTLRASAEAHAPASSDTLDAPAETTGSQGEEEALRTQLASSNDQVAQLRKELEDAISARNDVADAHTDWLKEREELKSQNEELKRLIEEERKRAESAEERIRDLRRTNEESRRAIMRLQQPRASTPRSETDASERSARRTSAILGPFTAKTLANAIESDGETEHKGLRDLQLVSPPQANSETFSPVLGSKIDEEQEEEAPAPPAKDHAEDGHAQTGITGLFPSSLLRPPFHLLRKSGPETQAPSTVGSQEDAATLESLRTEHGKAQLQLDTLQKEIAALQDQLLESREAQQASESLIKSLREYIVDAEQNGKRDAVLPLSDPAAPVDTEAPVTESLDAPVPS
ncbi:hypothetical protein MNAN1_002122 [Malassezia nana]|uniref:Uncharacterized protein n=1 Tax=Malassezia nana TaxID=180528 RepID=A0AAF0J2H8_9BASI|nr:hypothetical protein MNAN1_002122 [Malassezia nana]